MGLVVVGTLGYLEPIERLATPEPLLQDGAARLKLQKQTGLLALSIAASTNSNIELY